MREYMIYLFSSIIQIMAIGIFLKKRLGYKRKAYYVPFFWIGFELISWFINQIIKLPQINMIIYMCFLVCLSIFMCNGKIHTIVLNAIFFGVFTIAIELIVTYAFFLAGLSSLNGDYSRDIIVNIQLILAQLLILLCVRMMSGLRKDEIKIVGNGEYIVENCIIPVLGFVTMVIVSFHSVKYNYFSLFHISLMLMILIMDLLSFDLYEKFLNTKQIEIERKYYKKQSEIFNQWYENIRLVKQENAEFRHDVANHLNVIMGICNNEKDQPKSKFWKISEYISKMGMEFNETQPVTDTGNIVIDAILDAKYKIAIDEKIEVSYRILFPKNVKIDSIDFVTVVGNLLDNAIEASREMDIEKRTIKVLIKCDGNNLIIEVENNYSENSVLRKNQVTTKQDKISHGLGLKNVRKVVNKYNGEMFLKTENHIFQVKILLFGFIETI